MPREDPQEEEERRARSTYDLMRIQIERLQKSNKEFVLPPLKDELRAPKAPPEFVRNVVGSSAAAGSAEFHIYRNNRRKEQNRLDYIEACAKKEEIEKDFNNKMEAIAKEEEEKTAKKRLKRQKKKAAMLRARKNKKKKKTEESDDDEEEEEESGSEEEEDDE